MCLTVQLAVRKLLINTESPMFESEVLSPVSNNENLAEDTSVAPALAPRASAPSLESVVSRSCRPWHPCWKSPVPIALRRLPLAAHLSVSEAALYRHFARQGPDV